MRSFDKHAARDKRLLALERELNRLYGAQADAPIVPLERPYQRGWVKFYVLSDRLAQRHRVPMFHALLAQVNQRVYSRGRSFIDRAGHEIVLRPRIIPVNEWLKLGWPMSHQRFFGYGCWRIDDQPWTPIKWRRYITGFKLFHMWWLREDVQPNLITHQRVELPTVRSRIAEIEAELEATCGRDRLHWLHGQKHWWRLHDQTRCDLRAAQALSGQLQNITDQT